MGRCIIKKQEPIETEAGTLAKDLSDRASRKDPPPHTHFRPIQEVVEKSDEIGIKWNSFLGNGICQLLEIVVKEETTSRLCSVCLNIKCT